MIDEVSPPSIEDPIKGANPGINAPPGMGYIGQPDQDQDSDEDGQWLKRAQDAFRFSTTYFDSNHRKRLEDGIRMFNNQFPQDSKYAQPNYDKRSKIFRPKTRSIIRKHEAAAAAAFFSNMDVVSVDAENQSNQAERISAEVVKMLLEYRLRKTVPWFHTVLGGIQDAQKSGIVIARVYWEYEEREDSTIDKPVVKLIPAENFRVDQGADWTDPIGTSPYLIELVPMFAGDVKEKMGKTDPKTGRPIWHKASDAMLRSASAGETWDTTRIVREKNREDRYDTQARPVSDYVVVWIQRHIHRKDGVDWEFYTLWDQHLLTDPQPLKKSTWHGQRDYVMGCVILETHTSLPSSIPDVGRPLQDEANELANQRLDNIKFVLNKRWLVKRGKNVDMASLVRNVPGGITQVDDIETDIKEVKWDDVTASSFQEQDRINADMDDLLGNFSPGSVMTNKRFNETVGGMQLLNAPSSMMTEYVLRTFVETFVQPVLRLLVKCEQHYETDETILALAANKAQIFQRYGVSPQFDKILNADLTVRVNVGMGATDPSSKLQKFIAGATAFLNILKNAPPGSLNLQEVGKEIFGHLGYQDGVRFMTNDNPAVQDLQMKLQQAMQYIQQLGKQLNDATQDNQTKIEVAKINKEKAESVERIKKAGEDNGMLSQHKHMLEAHKLNLSEDRARQKLDQDLRLKAAQFVIDNTMKVQQHQKSMAAPVPTLVPGNANRH